MTDSVDHLTFSRLPKNVYETALFGVGGERKIVSPRTNVFSAPKGRHNLHDSYKSTDAIEYFFSQVVDETTSVFDPTCGGGSALIVAKRMGIKRALGIEQDKQMVAAANQALKEEIFGISNIEIEESEPT